MDEMMVLENIKGKKFVCSGQQLSKIDTDDGCQLNIVHENQDTYFDDESLSDDDLESEHGPNYLDQKSLLEASKREYIALSLNANRDPTKTRSKLADLLGDDDNIGCDDEFNNDHSTENYHKIHKRYRKLTSFDSILSDPESSFVDIFEGKVFKRSLVPGVTAKVEDDTLVIYNIALWAEGAKDPFDSTWLRRNTIVTDMSQDSILTGLNVLLLSCRKGEWCEALIRPEAAFGKLGVRPRIPPNATIFCVLEVVKLIKKDKIKHLSFNQTSASNSGGITFNDFWQASDEARKRGNHYYTEKQYRAAIQRYKSGIRILETLTYKNGEEEEAAKGLLLKLYNNLAKTANAAGEPRMALYACKQAGLISEFDSKTHWNRMIAWKKRGHYEKALSVAQRALQVLDDQANLVHFRKQIKELNAILDNEHDNLTDLYRLMGRYVDCA